MLQNAGLKFVASYSGGNLIFKEVLNEELDKIKEVLESAIANLKTL